MALSRRSSAALLALALLAAAGLAWREWARRAGPHPAWLARVTAETIATRPDLILVVYDARRRDDFSFGPFGNARGDTPFLARFKDEALYFEQAVSPGCWTVPVHAAMFSGLSACELGNDYFNPGWSSFPEGIQSLPEILSAAGYHTIAYADHPYFFNPDQAVSLVRGFRQFNVIADFESYSSATNVRVPGGGVAREVRLASASVRPTAEQVSGWLRGPAAAGDRADRDPVNDLLLAPLPPLFSESPYFEQRYGREFREHVFPGPPGSARRPFFLFLNLHMAVTARPDPVLFARWVTETLRLNAARRSRALAAPDAREDFDAWAERAAASLDLSHAPFPSRPLYLKHVFDNRFYDATFEALHGWLERQGLTRNAVTVVTSDHGQGLGAHGEALYVHAGARPHEDLIRVPLLVRYPAGSAGAALHGRRPEAVSLVDLFPTFLELGLGPSVFERSQPIRGQSLAARVREGRFEPYVIAESALGPDAHHIEPGTMGYAKAILRGSLKLIHVPSLYAVPPGARWPITLRLDADWPFATPRPPMHPRAQPLALLYDLAADPHERRNLAAERPDQVAELRALVRSWDCRGLPLGRVGATWQGESFETLRSLGYVQ